MSATTQRTEPDLEAALPTAHPVGVHSFGRRWIAHCDADRCAWQHGPIGAITKEAATADATDHARLAQERPWAVDARTVLTGVSVDDDQVLVVALGQVVESLRTYSALLYARTFGQARPRCRLPDRGPPRSVA